MLFRVYEDVPIFVGENIDLLVKIYSYTDSRADLCVRMP